MSKIEWTDETWNPIVGCSQISPGCDNCYAERMAGRLSNMSLPHNGYVNIVKWLGGKGQPKWNGTTSFIESTLDKPRFWKKPRRIFVCSMGDLFHESVKHSWRTKVFEVIQKCPQHTFLILTKRVELMYMYFKYLENQIKHRKCDIDSLPLKNVWLGVTAENQQQANKRIPILLDIPAVKRFVSVEPMLGPIDFYDITMNGEAFHTLKGFGDISGSLGYVDGRKLDYVICGSESGPGRRECDEDWVRSIRDQCIDAKTPFFLKQLHRNGKKVSVPKLDGKEWREMP